MTCDALANKAGPIGAGVTLSLPLGDAFASLHGPRRRWASPTARYGVIGARRARGCAASYPSVGTC